MAVAAGHGPVWPPGVDLCVEAGYKDRAMTTWQDFESLDAAFANLVQELFISHNTT
jgi:hypothetical protein